MAQPHGDAPVGRAEATSNITLNHNPFYVTPHQTTQDGERPGAAGARARDVEDSPRALLRAITYASPTGTTSDGSSMHDSTPSPPFVMTLERLELLGELKRRVSPGAFLVAQQNTFCIFAGGHKNSNSDDKSIDQFFYGRLD